jgi:hypothetical protein
MDLTDCIRLGQHENVVVALEILRPVLEALAAKGGLVLAQILDHRAHRAVEHEDAFACGPHESLGGRATGFACLGHANLTSAPITGRIVKSEKKSGGHAIHLRPKAE